MTFKHISKMAGAALALGFLAACASVTPYQQATRGGGYTDQALDDGRYRITFEGNSQTDLATIENYVLYRAAEVTLANGYDYFIVIDSNTEAMRHFVTTGTSFGGRGFGRRGFFYGHGFRGSRFHGRGFGGDFGSTTATTRERLSYTVGTIIEAHRGDKPSNSNAYDARQLIDNIGPRLVLQGEK